MLSVLSIWENERLQERAQIAPDHFEVDRLAMPMKMLKVSLTEKGRSALGQWKGECNDH